VRCRLGRRDVNDLLDTIWSALPALAHVLGAGAVTVDAVLRRRHVSAVIGWIGLAWLAPVIGSVLYLLFGINRIQRSALALGLNAAWDSEAGSARPAASSPQAPTPVDTPAASPSSNGKPGPVATGPAKAQGRELPPRFAGLDRLSGRITGNPLLCGNRIEPLEDGDRAYPAMLAAIDAATRSITLASYIFDNDATGRIFLEALQRAHQRGVQVRVLIDGLGMHYSRPHMLGALRRAGVPAAAFLPTRIPLPSRYGNLRNHRKIMVVDATQGFTGGMNLRDGHWLARQPARPVRCLHFAVQGPVVNHLQRTFAIDWAFASKERLHGEPWFAPLGDAGTVLARGIPDGPDADIDNIPQVLLGALAVARSRVRIVTPYFLPDDVLLAALKVTALRGVAVDLVLPARSNIRVMDWANRPQLLELLDSGCRVHLSPPPFDHTKLFLVDELWSLIGSTNWDARSLRLNFEYNLECYDAELVQRLDALVSARIGVARRMDAEALRTMAMPARLRNGLARLASPYL